MKKPAIYLVLAFILAFIGCSDDSSPFPENDLIVVRAYLYEGEPVDDIQLSGTLRLGSEDTTAPPISDADVSLVRKGVRYNLIPTEGKEGFYHYDGNDLTVEEGDEFEIEVNYYSKTASGKTIVPSSPKNLEMSSDVLPVPEDFSPFNFNPDSSDYQITLNWENDSSKLYYVTLESIEDDPDSIIINGRMMGGKMGRFMMSAPFNRNEYQVRFNSVTFFGTHKLKLYRINQEYADLYISRQQDSRDLNEPLTNIENGLGVFSAFNSDSVFFDVVAE